MGTEKTKWRELGLTPRQLSKKMGVTCSMAEFIAQSYRVPLRIKGPQVACARSPRRQKSSKKNPCTGIAAPRKRCEEAPDSAAPLPVRCSRKRRRSEAELSDGDDSSASCAWTKTKEVYECRDSSCSAPQSHVSNKDDCGKVSTSTCCSSPPRRKRCKVTRRPKARCLKRRRNLKSRRKKTARARRRKTVKCQAKQKLIPINLHLDVPLNIILEEKDGIQLERGGELCVKCKCPTAQGPPSPQEGSPAHMRDECDEARPGHAAQPQEEEEEEEEEEEGVCPEENELEECPPCEEDCSSEEKDDCGQKTKAKDSGPMSWWEKIQECMVFFESLLSSLINKC